MIERFLKGSHSWDVVDMSTDTFCLPGQGDDSDEAMAHLEDLVSQMNLSQTGFEWLRPCLFGTAYAAYVRYIHGISLGGTRESRDNGLQYVSIINMSQSPKSNSLPENISILLVSGHYLHC